MTQLQTIFVTLVGALTAHSVEENRAIAESRSARTFLIIGVRLATVRQ
jgi:hypothetical protein